MLSWNPLSFSQFNDDQFEKEMDVLYQEELKNSEQKETISTSDDDEVVEANELENIPEPEDDPTVSLGHEEFENEMNQLFGEDSLEESESEYLLPNKNEVADQEYDTHLDLLLLEDQVFENEKARKSTYSSNIEKLESLKKSTKLHKIKDYIHKMNVDDVLSSDLETIFLKKNTYLFSVDLKKNLRLNKDIYVKAHKKSDKLNFKYIVNKTGVLKYILDVKKIIPIKEVTKLREPPLYFKRLAKKIQSPKSKDRNLNYLIELNYGLGITNPYFTKDLFNLIDSNTYLFQNLHTTISSNWNSPFQIGLNLGMQLYTITGTNKDGQSRKFFTGFQLRSNKIKSLGDISAMVNADISIFSHTSSPENNKSYDLTDTKLEFGLQKSFENKKSLWSYGMMFSRIYSKPRNISQRFNVSPQRRYDDSLRLFLSHGWKVQW